MHSETTKSIIETLIHNSLERISDSVDHAKIASGLVTPKVTLCGHAFPTKGEPQLCWVVSELEKTKLGLVTCVYSEHMVADTDNKWGYANIDHGYFLGQAAWYNDFGLAALEWPSYRDLWFLPRKEVVGGSEFDWYARDSRGNIALFSSAGYGEIPEIVFSDSYAYAILDAYFSLDRVQMRISLDEWGTSNAFKGYADKGLYVFDWQQREGHYRKREDPAVPLNASAVDNSVRQFLTMVSFESVDFSSETAIEPAVWFQCWKPIR